MGAALEKTYRLKISFLRGRGAVTGCEFHAVMSTRRTVFACHWPP